MERSTSLADLSLVTKHFPVSNFSYPRNELSRQHGENAPPRTSTGSDASIQSMVEDFGSEASIEDDYQYHVNDAELWNSFWRTDLDDKRPRSPAFDLEIPQLVMPQQQLETKPAPSRAVPAMTPRISSLATTEPRRKPANLPGSVMKSWPLVAEVLPTSPKPRLIPQATYRLFPSPQPLATPRLAPLPSRPGTLPRSASHTTLPREAHRQPKNLVTTARTTAASKHLSLPRPGGVLSTGLPPTAFSAPASPIIPASPMPPMAAIAEYFSPERCVPATPGYSRLEDEKEPDEFPFECFGQQPSKTPATAMLETVQEDYFGEYAVAGDDAQTTQIHVPQVAEPPSSSDPSPTSTTFLDTPFLSSSATSPCQSVFDFDSDSDHSPTVEGHHHHSGMPNLARRFVQTLVIPPHKRTRSAAATSRSAKGDAMAKESLRRARATTSAATSPVLDNSSDKENMPPMPSPDLKKSRTEEDGVAPLPPAGGAGGGPLPLLLRRQKSEGMMRLWTRKYR